MTCWRTERLESMSVRSSLTLMRQQDGDFVLTIAEYSENGDELESLASVEFCTPFTGGGGSSNTHRALIELFGAMALDNLDDSQAHRRPEGCDMTEQRLIRNWVNQVNECNKHPLFRDEIMEGYDD